MTLRKDAQRIIEAAIQAAQPDRAVREAFSSFRPDPGKLVLIAVEKAGWQMAKAA